MPALSEQAMRQVLSISSHHQHQQQDAAAALRDCVCLLCKVIGMQLQLQQQACHNSSQTLLQQHHPA